MAGIHLTIDTRGLQTALDGAAVVGNSYITWINTGTRYGAIT